MSKASTARGLLPSLRRPTLWECFRYGGARLCVCRTTRHPGYGVSLRVSKQIEEAFGWIKTIAGQDKMKFRDRDRIGWAFPFAAAYDLVGLPKLLAASP